MSSLRLPPRYAAFVMPFVLSILMSLIVSGVATLRSLGFSPDYFAVWPMAWFLSWLVAFPTLLLVLPLVRRIVGLVVQQPAPR
ncbi:MAG: DUF2798 domain-containing protein [Pseudolabrys sp.]|nr:DUF2798 domain-containing protein [Pseudolabrys sp.]